MGWVRVSDDFYDHHGHAALELDAWGLWLWSLAWSNRNLSDGKVPAAIVKRMDPDGKATGALIDAERWEPCDGGIVVHAFLEWQPSAEEVRAKRAKERDRWQRRAGSTATPTQLRAESTATPPTSQPQPQHLSTTDEGGADKPARPRPRGTRIPDPFDVTTEMAEWAHRELGGFNWRKEMPAFLDYWRGCPGQKGVKADWPATWRNWMRRQVEGGFHR